MIICPTAIQNSGVVGSMSTSLPDSSPSLSVLAHMAWMALVLMIFVRFLQTPSPIIRLEGGTLSMPLEMLDDPKSTISFSLDVLVNLPEPRTLNAVKLSVEGDDVYRVEVLTAEGYIPVGDVGPSPGLSLASYRVDIPALPFSLETSQIRVSAIDGDGRYAIGRLGVE